MVKPKSTAQIAGHPIQPMLIILTLVSDLAFWRTPNDFSTNASLWLRAALAAVMDLVDVVGDPKISDLSYAWLHAEGNLIAVVIDRVTGNTNIKHE
jgi:uncharacterized membrane protein